MVSGLKVITVENNCVTICVSALVKRYPGYVENKPIYATQTLIPKLPVYISIHANGI